MRKTLAKFLYALVALLCALFVLSIRYRWYVKNHPLQNTISDQASGWESYRNDTHGFEIRYPKGYKVINDSYNPGTFIIGPIPSANETMQQFNAKGELRIIFLPNPNNLSLDDAARANRFYSDYKKEKEIEISNTKAYQFVPKSSDPLHTQVDYYFLKNSQNEIVQIAVSGSIAEAVNTLRFFKVSPGARPSSF